MNFRISQGQATRSTFACDPLRFRLVHTGRPQFLKPTERLLNPLADARARRRPSFVFRAARPVISLPCFEEEPPTGMLVTSTTSMGFESASRVQRCLTEMHLINMANSTFVLHKI
jgi:hypothetical protein